MKKRMISLLGVLLLLGNTSSFANSTAIQVQLDGKPLSLTPKPYMDAHHRVLVPVRFVSEALGASVSWRQETKQVEVKKQNKKVVMSLRNSQYYVNGNLMKMDTAPIMKENRVFVPIRFVSEALDQSVNWNDKSKTVVIKNKVSVGKDPKTSEELIALIRSFKGYENATLLNNGNGYVLFDLDGKIQYFRYDGAFYYANTSKDYAYNLSLDYIDAHSEGLVKELLKYFYPSSYEKAYQNVLAVNKMAYKEGQSSIKTRYDGRNFDVGKANDNKGIVLWIGVK